MLFFIEREMKKISRINLRNLAVVILIIAVSLLVYLITDFNKTESSLAQSLIRKTQQTIISKLDNYFLNIEKVVEMASSHSSSLIINNVNGNDFKNYFQPILKNANLIKYAVIASSNGNEEVIYEDSNHWTTLNMDYSKTGNTSFWNTWNFTNEGEWKKIDSRMDLDSVDFRSREWFSGAVKNKHEVYWTDPFFYSTGEAGISATRYWENTIDTNKHIIGFGLTLNDISEFTQTIQASTNSKIFILSSSKQFVGLPRNPDSINAYANTKNKKIELSSFPLIDKAHQIWNENKSDSPFLFKQNGNKWYASFSRYYLSESTVLNVGIILPQSDILSEMKRTKRIIVGSFIFILILTGFVLYSNSLTQRANTLLTAKNRKISEQHCEIEQKNKHILDSIKYARRIQQALLPSIHHVNELLKDNFILYKPKDVVAGDFYWMEQNEGTVYFAAADCTGHGVPGAMVSFVCIKALNQSVIDYQKYTPASILDKTRELVIQEFQKSDDEVKDGMDIALCAINGNKLQYAGANNALYIIRGNELIETKADKQPIGNYVKNGPYTNHEFEMQDDDTIYIFSDGYADQFGGPDNRKYKSKNMKVLLLSIQHESMELQKQMLDQAFEDWKGVYEQIDDVCFWGYRHHC